MDSESNWKKTNYIYYGDLMGTCLNYNTMLKWSKTFVNYVTVLKTGSEVRHFWTVTMLKVKMDSEGNWKKTNYIYYGDLMGTCLNYIKMLNEATYFWTIL